MATETQSRNSVTSGGRPMHQTDANLDCRPLQQHSLWGHRNTTAVKNIYKGVVVPKSESSAAPAKPRLASLKRPHKQPPLTAAAARALWRRCAPPFLLRNNHSPLCLPVKTYGRCERRLVSLMPAWSAAARRTRVCWTLEECVCACVDNVCAQPSPSMHGAAAANPWQRLCAPALPARAASSIRRWCGCYRLRR